MLRLIAHRFPSNALASASQKFDPAFRFGEVLGSAVPFSDVSGTCSQDPGTACGTSEGTVGAAGRTATWPCVNPPGPPALDSWPPLGSLRHKHHWERRMTGPNLLQECDTNDIDRAIQGVTYLEHAALPAFTFGPHLSPAQACALLSRLPRVVRYQHSRRRPALDQTVLLAAVLDAVGSRLAQVVGRCRGDDLARALGAFGSVRRDHPQLFSAAGEHLLQLTASQSATDPPPLQQHAAAAALPATTTTTTASSSTPGTGSTTGAQRLQQLLRQLVPPTPADLLLSPQDLATVAWAYVARVPFGGTLSGPDREVLEGVLAALERDGAVLDHHGVCKVVWSMAQSGVVHRPLLQRLVVSATAQIREQLAGHDPASGRLQPRRTYRYLTVRGWVEQDTPKTPRVSKYRRPRPPPTVVRDYEYDSLASLLSVLAKLRLRDREFAKAAAAHVKAMAQDVAPAAAAAAAAAGASGVAEPLPIRPPQPLSVLRMLRGLGYQGGVDRDVAEAVLADAPLHKLTAKQLVAATYMATRLGAREPRTLRRLSRALIADADGLQRLGLRDVVAVAAAYQRAGHVDPPAMERLAAVAAAAIIAATEAGRGAGGVTPALVARGAQLFTLDRGHDVDMSPLVRALEVYVVETNPALDSEAAVSVAKLLLSTRSPSTAAVGLVMRRINVQDLSAEELTQLRDQARRAGVPTF